MSVDCAAVVAVMAVLAVVTAVLTRDDYACSAGSAGTC